MQGKKPLRIIMDMHVHTNHSDGSCTVEEVIRMARDQGVTHIGIVDHDTIHGISEAKVWGNRFGVTVVPGVELSAFHPSSGKKVHILGYGFKEEAPHIRRISWSLLSRRTAQSLWQTDRLASVGYPVSQQEVKEKAWFSSAVYKQHIMAVLYDKGCTDGIVTELYEKLFKGQGICAQDIPYMNVFEAIEAVKQDGGLAVLAHPGQTGAYGLVPELVKAGLDGLELGHMDHGAWDKDTIRLLALQYKLFVTGGSDFHGAYGRKAQIGDYALKPPECLDFLLRLHMDMGKPEERKSVQTL